jgi:hypothetical protein
MAVRRGGARFAEAASEYAPAKACLILFFFVFR